MINGLKYFLLNQYSDESTINYLKKLLLKKFEEYCEKNLSPEAEEAIIVSIYQICLISF